MDLGAHVRWGCVAAPKAFGYDRDGHRPRGARGRRPGAGRVRLSRGAGRRTVRPRRDWTAAPCSSRPPPCSSPGPIRWAFCIWKAGGSRTRCPVRSSTSGWAWAPRLPEPRLHRRPVLLRHRRIPVLLSSTTSSAGRARRRRVRGLRRRLVRGVAPADRVGRGIGLRLGPAAHRYRCAAVRSRSPLRERRPGRRAGSLP